MSNSLLLKTLKLEISFPQTWIDYKCRIIEIFSSSTWTNLFTLEWALNLVCSFYISTNFPQCILIFLIILNALSCRGLRKCLSMNNKNSRDCISISGKHHFQSYDNIKTSMPNSVRVTRAVQSLSTPCDLKMSLRPLTGLNHFVTFTFTDLSKPI